MRRNTLLTAAITGIGVLIIIVAVAVFNINNGNASSAFSLEDDIVYLGVGQIYRLPVNGDGMPRFRSYDSRIASVDENGVITAEKAGSTVIKAGSEKLELHIIEPPTSLTAGEKSFTLGVGEKYKPLLKTDGEATIAGIAYTVSDEGVIEIDAHGTVTAKAAGKTTVTAETYNGLKAAYEITVKNAPEKMTLSAFNSKLYTGTEFDLKVDFGKNACAKGLAFETDNDAVLTVDEKGRAKALAAGKANVTVTAYNGVTAKCTLTVLEKPYYIRTDLDPDKPMAAFTFDDGPNAPTTDRILNTLEKYGCSATFFIVGSRTKNSNHAECVKKMAENGFEIGNHTYDHKHYGSDVKAQDISKCSDKLFEVSGQYSSVFRPTGGYITDEIKKSCNMPLILWNVDTQDWRSKNASKVYSHLKKDIEDGSVILMHDIYKSTAEAVEKAVPELVKSGWQIVNVSELAYYSGVDLQNGRPYYSF